MIWREGIFNFQFDLDCHEFSKCPYYIQKNRCVMNICSKNTKPFNKLLKLHCQAMYFIHQVFIWNACCNIEKNYAARIRYYFLRETLLLESQWNSFENRIEIGIYLFRILRYRNVLSFIVEHFHVWNWRNFCGICDFCIKDVDHK